MQKEKKVRTYTRRTKSGKTVTVRAHTARYDAFDEKEVVKKRGSGKEFEARKRNVEDTPAHGITAEEYKKWYHTDLDDPEQVKEYKKTAKKMRAFMGRAAYNKYEKEMTDNYSARGHLKGFKGLSAFGKEYSTPKKNKSKKFETSTPESPAIPKSESALKKAGWTYVRTNRNKVGGGSKGYWVSPDRETMVFGGSDYRPGRGRSVTIESDKPKKPTKSVLALLDRDSRASTTSAKTEKEISSKTKTKDKSIGKKNLSAKEEYTAYRKAMDEKKKVRKRLSVTETTKLKKLAKAAGVGRFIE